MNNKKQEQLIYGYTKKVHELAELYISRDIIKCDTSLIDDLLNYSEEGNPLEQNFNYDRVENIYYISPKWIRDLSLKEQSLLQLYNFRTMEDFSDFMEYSEMGRDAVDSDGNEVSIEDAEHNEILEDIHYVWKYRDSEAQEVFEWWSVSKWLAGELIALGEPVMDNDYGYWWGRTCSGQAIILDGTIQKIALQYVGDGD